MRQLNNWLKWSEAVAERVPRAHKAGKSADAPSASLPCIYQLPPIPFPTVAEQTLALNAACVGDAA